LIKNKIINENGEIINMDALLGTGEGLNYENNQMNILFVQDEEEIQLFRAMCEAEYISIINNNDKFVSYDYAMEKKWFATCHIHAKKWGDLFYPYGTYKIIEITVLKVSLKYMFFVKFLDNIGPAYAADVILLNKIVKRVRLV